MFLQKKAKNNYGLFSNKKLMPKEKSYAKKQKKNHGKKYYQVSPRKQGYHHQDINAFGEILETFR